MSDNLPEISIVTPSFNMAAYLPMCCSSVADQGISVEHIVMDGGSTDGSVEWLANHGDIVFVSEKDKGMYNALNKAIDKARGEIIGHLNCDEQYLPGALRSVQEFFIANPDVDFVAADFLVIDPEGDFLAFRKSFTPRWQYFFSNYLYTNTCTLFYRRKVFEHCKFDESYRSIADVIFLYDVIKKGFRGAHMQRYVAVFTYSGVNLSLHPISAIEKRKFSATLPRWYRLLKPMYFVLFFVERALNHVYREKSTLSYSIFTTRSGPRRATITKKNPGFRLQFKPSPGP